MLKLNNLQTTDATIHRPSKSGVPGSNPGEPTNFIGESANAGSPPCLEKEGRESLNAGKTLATRAPQTRLFSFGAWAGPLNGLTLREWKKAGGCGITDWCMGEIVRDAKLPASRLEDRLLSEIVLFGLSGRITERGFARFCVDNTDQLKPALRPLASMVEWEFDQDSGAWLRPTLLQAVPHA